MTHKEKILRSLRAVPAVCGTYFLQEHMPRYAARIYELRDEGHIIISRPCTRPGHSHMNRQTEYVLVERVYA